MRGYLFLRGSMDEKKKLLFVIENSGYGGGERSFAQLLRGLSPGRWELFCASRPEGRFYSEVRDVCRFLPLDLGRRFDPFNICRLRRLLRDNAIDIVHSQGARADFFCGLAARGTGALAVATAAAPVDVFDVGPVRKTLYRSLYAYAARRFSACITVSEPLAAMLRRYFPSVDVIPNGVDLSEFSPDRFDAGPVIERFGLRGKLVLGAVGRLEKEKGHACLLEALAAALRAAPELRGRMVCLIAGAGSQERQLRKMAEGLGLKDSVVFCGEVAGTRDLLGAVDIFIMPSLSEGQPLALLEAMAMGKPVIASDIPGISGTAAGGSEAVLVPPGNAASLAAAIGNMAGDIPAALALGRGARLKACSYSLDAFVGAHEAFYGRLCGGR